jgi:hypothetical protein
MPCIYLAIVDGAFVPHHSSFIIHHSSFIIQRATVGNEQRAARQDRWEDGKMGRGSGMVE